MRVHFHTELRPDVKGEVVPTEYVSIHTGRDGKDVVDRRATDLDRDVFAEAYASFQKNPMGLAHQQALVNVVEARRRTLEPEERVLSELPEGVIVSGGPPPEVGGFDVEVPEPPEADPEPEEKFSAKFRKKK